MTLISHFFLLDGCTDMYYVKVEDDKFFSAYQWASENMYDEVGEIHTRWGMIRHRFNENENTQLVFFFRDELDATFFALKWA